MKENVSFLLINIGFALMFGFYIAFGNLISSILTPFGLSATDITAIGLKLLASGVVGSVLVGVWIDYTKTFKVTSVVLAAINIGMLVIINESLYHIEHVYTLFVISCCLMGFSSIAYIPLTLSFAAELTFPL